MQHPGLNPSSGSGRLPPRYPITRYGKLLNKINSKYMLTDHGTVVVCRPCFGVRPGFAGRKHILAWEFIP